MLDEVERQETGMKTDSEDSEAYFRPEVHLIRIIGFHNKGNEL
jgi:hypothetical protein